MNRFTKKYIETLKQKLFELEAKLAEVQGYISDGWPEEEELIPEEIDELIAETVEETPVNWTTADEPAKEGPYLKDLTELTSLKGLSITGQIKATSDLKSYKKKDGSGIGLIYNVLLSDPTGDLLCVFWDEQVEEAKKFTIGQFVRITNAWKVQKNKMNKLELHPGKYAKIEVVE